MARARLTHRGPLLLALTAAAIILVIDVVLWNSALPLPIAAPLDEVAHAATMVLLLCALVGRVPRAFVAGSLLWAVILDVDHLAFTLHWHAWAPVHGRPYSHSLATVIVVTLLTCLPRRWRPFGLGAACGLLSHLFRDLADGVVPLFWPITTQHSIPYPLYVAAILAVLAWVGSRGAGFGRGTGRHEINE